MVSLDHGVSSYHRGECSFSATPVRMTAFFTDRDDCSYLDATLLSGVPMPKNTDQSAGWRVTRHPPQSSLHSTQALALVSSSETFLLNVGFFFFCADGSAALELIVAYFFLPPLRLVGLGQQFATIEAVTFMSLMFRRFSFELVDPHNEPGYGAGLTLPVEKGLPIRVIRRDQVESESVPPVFF